MATAFVDVLSEAGVAVVNSFLLQPGTFSTPMELAQAGFQSVMEYGVEAPMWMGVRSFSSRAVWFDRSQGEISLRFRERMSEPAIRSLTLLDSAQVAAFKFPSRLSENMWCEKQREVCDGGHGFNPDAINVPATALEVRVSGVGTRAGRGVFARAPIARGCTVAMEQCVHGVLVPPSTLQLITLENSGTERLLAPVRTYVFGYGWISDPNVRDSKVILVIFRSLARHLIRKVDTRDE